MTKFKLSKEILENIATTKNELNRFYRLTPRFKARALIEYAHVAKSELPELLDGIRDTARKDGYNHGLINIIIPGLAYRLGETQLNADEMNSIGDFPFEPQKIRNMVSMYMKNADMYNKMNLGNAPVTEFLGHDFINGNVITMAMDEIAPPTSESDDWVARHMREISHGRFGDERYDAWCPEFQEYERNNMPELW